MNAETIPKVKKTTIYLLFTITLFMSMKRVFIGLDFNDSPFIIYKIVNEGIIANSFFPGLFLIGQFWAAMFNDSFISFRLLFFIIILINLAITYKIALLISRNRFHVGFLLSNIAVIIIGCSAFVFSYDIVSAMSLLLVIYFSFKIYYNNKPVDAFILGVITIVAISFKFPNAVVIFPSFLVLILVNFNMGYKHLFSSILFYLTPFIIIILMILIGIYGEIDIINKYYYHFFEMLNGSLKVHSVENLFSNYTRDGNCIINYFLLILLAYNAARFIAKKTKLNLAIALCVLLSVFNIIIVYLSFTFIWNLRLFITSCALFYICLIMLKISDVRLKLFILITAIIMFIPAAGSNTGLLKAWNLSVYLIPIFIVCLNEFQITKNDENNYYIAIIISFIPAALILGALWSYGDINNPFKQLNNVGVERLNGIYTTSERREYVINIYYKYKDIIGDNDIIFLGNPSNLFYYIFEKQPFYKASFIEDIDNEAFVNQLVEKIAAEKKKPLVIYFPGSQYDQSWPSILKMENWKNATYTSFLLKMKQSGYLQKVYDDHVLFE